MGMSLADRREWWSNNADRLNAERRAEYERRKDEINARRRAQEADNRSKVRAANREQYARDPGPRKASASINHRLRKLRVPSWADLDSIKQFYRDCPEGHEVDHVIPLLGELVSGLHVLDNLQYLPIAQNRAKRNRYAI
jgi:hypothetical protein